MKLLDLCCKAGVAAMGYFRAGFDVVGVDIEPQPNYPFEFILGDALNPPVDLSVFDVVHASPPCQKFSVGTRRWGVGDRVDLLTPMRQWLIDVWGGPYVIENVPGAPMRVNLFLTGPMFGLGVVRRRHFESNIHLAQPAYVRPQGTVSGGEYVTVAGHGGNGSAKFADWKRAMEIDWMTKAELTQAVPPAYTEYIGKELCKTLDAWRHAEIYDQEAGNGTEPGDG